jgi:catechol 2,3-dioxygenase-like lactoylglutathione lyase family enzyme
MKIDHIALQVDDVKESVDYYVDEYGCSIIYCDDTWAFLQFENIKLALVVEDEHPYHIAFETDEKGVLNGTLHRDGSVSKYVKDPSGNTIELIKYPTKTKHFADGFHEGRWEED